MNGLSHASIAGVTGLVPDLDTGGELANKITIPRGFIRLILAVLGLLIIACS